jgi:fission process protein 1
MLNLIIDCIEKDEWHSKSMVDNFERGFSGYLPYVARFGNVIRYSAYMSDVGEAFRPIANKWLVRGTYGVSWAYVVGDVSWEAYKTRKDDTMTPHQWRMNIAKRATFQSLASMAFPAFTIHSVVHIAKHNFFPKFFPQYLKWGPTISGLAVIPFLPYMFDHPVEYICDNVFYIK